MLCPPEMMRPVFYAHSCPVCEAPYVPFDEVPCPRCGRREADRFDLVGHVVQAAEANLADHGAYRPTSFLVASLGDHLLLVTLRVLDRHRRQGGMDSFRPFAEEMLDEMDWGDQEYLRDHALELCLRVRARLGAPPGEGVERA